MRKISDQLRRKGWYLFRNKKVKVDLITPRRIYFKVEGETEEHSVVYDRELNEWSCDCKYWSLKFKWCSHIYACWLWLRDKGLIKPKQ
ncbi:MAG: SWIM zinc finger family protein [Candidatus Aenigmarchaeota archaeon]|nr:SWIM zinc finger family protein [Candidatus Aenigmarchaeota archaeon]